MSRNGSGVYSLPAGSTVANGDVSDATDINTPLADIAADLNIARPIVAGGTGATSASAARTALGLAIGTDVQAYDAKLAAEAALSPIADRLSFYTGATTKNTTPFASSARSLLSLTPVADKIPYFSGSSTAALADFTSAGRALVDDADASAQLTTLGLSAFFKTLVSAADIAALFALFGASWTVASPGTYTLPGGLVVKWGTASAISAGGGVTVTFGAAFPTAIFGVLATPIASANNTNVYTVGYRAAAVGSVVITNNSGTSGPVSAFWVAFGN